MKLFIIKRAGLLVVAGLVWSTMIVTYPSIASTSAYDQHGMESLSVAQLQQILAPIALYPDTLLSHILIATTYPLEIVQAHRWQQKHRLLSGAEAVNAAELEGWDPSVAALVAFPDLLQQLSLDLEWTQTLGEAFLADESNVLDQVQYLREKAYSAGNLQKMEHVKVVREQRVIYIEPAFSAVMYLPYYDTKVIFGSWWWPTFPPYHWSLTHSHARLNRYGFYWGPRIVVHHNFYFTAPRWREHRIVVTDRHRSSAGRKFVRARQVADFHKARHWQHQIKHRRNINYRNTRVRARYQPDSDRVVKRRLPVTEHSRGGDHHEHRSTRPEERRQRDGSKAAVRSSDHKRPERASHAEHRNLRPTTAPPSTQDSPKPIAKARPTVKHNSGEHPAASPNAGQSRDQSAKKREQRDETTRRQDNRTRASEQREGNSHRRDSQHGRSSRASRNHRRGDQP